MDLIFLISGIIIIILVTIDLFSTIILMNGGGKISNFISKGIWPGSVIDTSSEVNTNHIGKIYFVGYTISSLGNGDLKSGSDAWRIISNLMSIYGTFFITLSISYLIPVLDSVIKKRAPFRIYQSIGKNPGRDH